MLIYWLMFLFPSLFAVVEASGGQGPRKFDLRWVFVFVALVLLIGFRWETGGDWGNYHLLVQNEFSMPAADSIAGEPGFRLLNHIAAVSPYGMLVITVAGALIFSIGLALFCFDQPRPWLCLAVAIPYFVVVLGMGYIRQGIAISFMLIGLRALGRGGVLRYALWVTAGAMFHATAFVLLPLGFLVSTRSLLGRIALSILASAILVYVISSARTDTYLTNYVETELSSSGAAIRLIMTAVPAAIFLWRSKRFGLAPEERSIWLLLSWASLALLAGLAFSQSSTVVDRLGLYLLPVQCFVYARLPEVLAGDQKGERAIVVAILLLYAAAFFVWLNYAANVSMWLPYRSWLLEDGICLAC